MKGGKSNSGAKQTPKKLSVKKCSYKAAKISILRDHPRTPPTAGMIFVNEFLGNFAGKFKNSSELVRAASTAWKTASDADKAPYVAKAAELQAVFRKRAEEYTEFLYAYTKKKDAIKAESMAVAEELGANMTGLII